MTTTVTIGANEEIWDSLTKPDYESLLEWFRVNRINPEEIRTDHQITIAAGLMGAGLAERVQAVYLARVEKYARIAAEVAGAHAAADAAERVRKDAGL